MKLAGSAFNRSELADATGDLGTLEPFVVGFHHASRRGLIRLEDSN